MQKSRGAGTRVRGVSVIDLPISESGNAYYFAFGSNLNKQGMQSRYMQARAVGGGLLRGYRLSFGSSGLATIFKDEKCVVYGGIWLITLGDCVALDRYEGYPLFYTRFTVDVESLSDSVRYRAFTYQLLPSFSEFCSPSVLYSKECLQGYSDFGLDASHFHIAAQSFSTV